MMTFRHNYFFVFWSQNLKLCSIFLLKNLNSHFVQMFFFQMFDFYTYF